MVRCAAIALDLGSSSLGLVGVKNAPREPLAPPLCRYTGTVTGLYKASDVDIQFDDSDLWHGKSAMCYAIPSGHKAYLALMPHGSLAPFGESMEIGTPRHPKRPPRIRACMGICFDLDRLQ